MRGVAKHRKSIATAVQVQMSEMVPVLQPHMSTPIHRSHTKHTFSHKSKTMFRVHCFAMSCSQLRQKAKIPTLRQRILNNTEGKPTCRLPQGVPKCVEFCPDYLSAFKTRCVDRRPFFSWGLIIFEDMLLHLIKHVNKQIPSPIYRGDSRCMCYRDRTSSRIETLQRIDAMGGGGLSREGDRLPFFLYGFTFFFLPGLV
jgi:hypothetical protein